MSAPALFPRHKLVDLFARRTSPGIYAALDELIRESLRTLLPVTTVIAWLWSVVVILGFDAHTVSAYAVLVVTLVAAAVSYQVQTRNLRLGVFTYLGGLILAVALIASVSRTTEAFCLFALVVLVTATLTGARAVWLVTAVCVVIILLLGLGSEMELLALGLALLIVLMAALTAWLSARRLFTALEWALNMTAESQRNATEAQKHRGEVQRVLRNLDEAYVRLEHTNEALLFARDAAEKAYRFKSDFVANVSHELRTPLNLIIGFSEMMATAPESYGGVQLPREYRGDVMATYRSARHLSDLINDVLDLSQIEAGRMPINKELTDLGNVVREATDIVRGLVEARGLRLEVVLPEDLPLFHLDRTRIRQVLLNLLTNATRFTDRGWIRARVIVVSTPNATTEDPHEAIITIEDSGRGIPPAKLARAFEAFTQLHEDQIREGTGLGLAVSKRFVTLHAGRMWIESVEGQGTTVGFSLPMTDIQVSAQRMGRALHVDDSKPTVLMLHDDPRTLAMLRRYIEGYEFVMAPTLDRAKDWLQRIYPIAILADTAWMERVIGDTPAARELEQMFVVPMLRAPLPGTRRTHILLGAVDFLPKPVTREMLAQALERLDRPYDKILIVDDDPHVVRLMGRMIKAEEPDVQVLEAFDGSTSLDIAREQKPDVILLDLLMPGMSGYDVLQAISQDSTLASIPIIIVSARGLDDEGAPVTGEVRLLRARGFTATEMLQVIGSTLNGVSAMTR